jgi:hypothetical protein
VCSTVSPRSNQAACSDWLADVVIAAAPTMSAVTDAPHRLLVSHFTNWTQAKGREVDVQLLEGLLDLRATYDDLEPTLWPAGSVQDLLLRLVPAKGPTEPLPSDATVDALEAYFRFLRSTGRMSARSATPADLAKEARRSAKKMAAAARDRTNWSPGKTMIDFGASIGLSLDDLSSADELQGRLDQISAAWNELPIHERQRLDPPKGNLSGRTRAMTAYQTEIEMEALIRSFTYQMPQGDLPSPGAVAPIIREAALISQLEALTRWIEPRAEVTATGVLRPAAARQAFVDLGLASWMRESLRIDYAEVSSRVSPEEMETLLDTVAPMQTWRSARDCPALDRLWNAALTCRVIRIAGRWAYAAWPEQLDDEAIVNLATDAGLDLLFSFLDDDAFGLPVLGYALLRSYVRRPRPVPWGEIADFAESWVLPPSERAGPADDIYRRLIRSSLHRALHNLSDLGIFSQTANEIVLNAWGDVFVSAWLSVELPSSDVDR